MNGIIYDPITLPPNETIGRARREMDENKISGIPIVEKGNRVVPEFRHGDVEIRVAVEVTERHGPRVVRGSVRHGIGKRRVAGIQRYGYR